MAFVDECTLYVASGRGGDGSVSMHSEPYKARGGPDGGSGGNGGSVILEVTAGIHDLSWLADHPHQRAVPGANGRSTRRDGASGKDLVLPVPDGTVVFDDEGFVADLTGVGSRAVVAAGGRGGRGNSLLTSSRNRAPRFAEPGESAEVRTIALELRTVADVGLVGLPNAGKSTLLSRLTAAKPKIADYPFTTLTPNLGVAGMDADRFVVADVPGLIEGAADGKGLGHRFLRHVVRCRALVLGGRPLRTRSGRRPRGAAGGARRLRRDAGGAPGGHRRDQGGPGRRTHAPRPPRSRARSSWSPR